MHMVMYLVETNLIGSSTANVWTASHCPPGLSDPYTTPLALHYVQYMFDIYYAQRYTNG